jgi:ubiquitin C-terminal hydrolase
VSIQCIDLYCIGEILDGENAVYLDDTKKEKVDVQKRIRFWSFPNILVIALKRFDNFNNKNNSFIQFPFVLDLSSYVIGYNKEKYIYNLFGICNQFGSTKGGHYTSFIQENITKKWYHVNDEYVQEVTKPEMMITNSAYVLFYKKTQSI